MCVSDQLLLLLVLPRHNSHMRGISIGIPAVCERQINAHVLLSWERGDCQSVEEGGGRGGASAGHVDISVPRNHLFGQLTTRK